MIIEGNPELGLQKHQQDAYKSVLEAHKEGNKASIVIPTGCGKSFIALQLMADNRDKRILFMAPTRPIRNQMYNYIAKYVVGERPSKKRPARMIAEEHFPNLKIMLYPALIRLKDEQMKKLKADIIIMDELHRTGADKWGTRVNTLLANNQEAKILGLTATPDRMDDKNVVDELFEGKIDYELTLLDALRNRIVKSPIYVKCDYALGEYLDGIKSAIDNSEDENTKKALQEKYDKMRKIVEHADGIPELFAKNIKKKDGKYIVFCKDKNHMNELMEKAKEWFKDIDDKPEIYSVYSGEAEKANRDTIRSFENTKSKHLKVLFSIDMLNEGLHVEDISGVIMTRPTDSRIIYLQQLGRALSSDTEREQTIIFDLVNNYLKNNLDREINRKTKEIKKANKEKNGDYESGSEKETEIEDIDIFRIQGETKNFLDLLEEAREIISTSSYLTNARAIQEWIKNSGDTKPPSASPRNKEERRLYDALHAIKRHLIKPYLELQTEEEREQFKRNHPYMDEILTIINQIDKNYIPTKLKHARAIQEWIKNSGDTKPPASTAKDPNEKKLGLALQSIRKDLIKPYLDLQTEEERDIFRETHPKLDEILDIIQEIDNNNIPQNLKNAIKIKEWIEKSGVRKPPSTNSKDEEEKRLGRALNSIRSLLIKPYINLATEEEQEKFRKAHPEIGEVLAIINEIDNNNIPTYLRNAREIKEWIEKSGDTNPPTRRTDNEEEKRLCNALDTIRRKIVNPYLELKTEKERKNFKRKHPQIDEVLAIINEIDNNNIHPYLKSARKIREWIEKSGDTKPPSSSSKNEEEKQYGRALLRIRRNLLKPYMDLETEEERESFRQAHPEIDEVLAIINKIDNNNNPPYLRNAKELREWIKKSGDLKFPVAYSDNREERRLGMALANMRHSFIKPYITLKTEEKRESFRKVHPEIDEVLDIICELDMQCGTQKQKELAILIRQDLEKRKALQEARKLEQDYERQLSIQKEKTPDNTQKQGVDFDEQ